MPEFDRKFFDSTFDYTGIGNGAYGGKAEGLIRIDQFLIDEFDESEFPDITVSIPRMTVLTTDVFDEFMKINKLYELVESDADDYQIAHAFQKTEMPSNYIGDLYALISEVKSPLAIRSSSLLEDALNEPFAGIYETKMISNNQFDRETRFHKLIEAIKFVYASTFFKNAKDYLAATSHTTREEKMAVILQEIVGKNHNGHFYPHISGVARSYNYYPIGAARPEDGIVSLALGLGKSIVDDGISWNYSPALPRANPPVANTGELMSISQNAYWAVNMGQLSSYDPVKETEYLIKLSLENAEHEKTLKYICSSYDPQSDRLYPGYSAEGLKIINFAPILQLNQLPLNSFIQKLLQIAEESFKSPVEIEFAITLDQEMAPSARLGFLQVRPMVVSQEVVDLSPEDLTGEDVLIASENVMGNGCNDNISDVIFVKPEKFEANVSRNIASEIEKLNEKLHKGKIPYLLVGFGRWGSSDPWLGIPVKWGQISAARVIVESTLPEMNVELSQGTHFFHNLSSFQIGYFSVRHSGKFKIDWNWLNKQQIVQETNFVKQIKLSSPLNVKIDGRTGRGVIKKW
jgi:hypothetical protein